MSERAGWVAVCVAALGLATFYATWSVLLHRSFGSNGWDLGIFDQVVWNTAHGRPFEYSFRDMSYLGDHWQPVLLLLAPLMWVTAGAEVLLVVQAVALGAAAIPLYGFAKGVAGRTAAWAAVLAFGGSLGVSRAAAFDFHPEAFVPALVFGGLWAAKTGRAPAFAGLTLALLTIKEDGALIAVAVCWLAWMAFGLRREALAVGAIAIAHLAVVSAVIMPWFRGDHGSPLSEKYGYLYDVPWQAAWALVEHVFRWDSVEAGLLVLAGVAFLPVVRPRYWPALAVTLGPPLISDDGGQATLAFHYMLVPSTMAVAVAVLCMPEAAALIRARTFARQGWTPAAAGVMGAAAVIVYGLFSPLPPSTDAQMNRFHADDHARSAQEFVGMVPDAIVVSAQSAFVPHLSEREEVLQFPQVGGSLYVLLDENGAIPGFDWDAGFEACREALPRLGFEVERAEGGITLWRRVRLPGDTSGLPWSCAWVPDGFAVGVAR